MSAHGKELAILTFLEGFGVNIKIVLALTGVSIIAGILYISDIQTSESLGFAFISAPVWLPLVTFFMFFDAWNDYVQKEYILSFGRVSLELKIPQEIFKSPQAMEMVLLQMNQSASPDNHKETYFDGKHPPRFSLELVSRQGDVRLYINVPRRRWKEMIETQLYAQYPGIEVAAQDIDYTAEFPWDPEKYIYFGFHYGTKKDNAYPIKTYVDFGLDTMPKEEEKVDPMTSMLEMLGSIGPGENLWIQIIIKVHKAYDFKTASLTKTSTWEGDARKIIKEIIEKANERVGIKPNVEGQRLSMMNVSDTEKDTIKSIERSLAKSAFEVAIRSMYIATPDKFRIGDRAPQMITAWRPYEDLNRNAISVRWRTDYDWNWWQDPSGHRRAHLKYAELDEYKRRAYDPKSHLDPWKIMTTEELATIFHIPGKVALTPSLARIPSKRTEAPSNLPVG